MNTETATQTTILVGKCGTCKTLTRVERAVIIGTMPDGRPTRSLSSYHVDCDTCGRRTNSKEATLSAIKCGPKCVNATGPACSCECGGRNHGAH